MKLSRTGTRCLLVSFLTVSHAEMLDYRILHITALLTILQSAFYDTSSSFKKDPNGKSGSKGRTLKTQRVTTDDGLTSVYCPDLNDDQENHVNISLHRKQYTLHTTNFTRTQELNDSELRHRFHVSVKNDTVQYFIDKPQANDTDLYCCEVRSSADISATEYTVLIVKDLSPFCPHDGRPVSWLMLTAGCGFFALYNIVVTVVTCFFGWKLKNEESNKSDYYNIKPREVRSTR
ncbi:T-cell-specific surface glycoprotein CD28-like [Hoplias malabaricus]|uniref:T-cell-specific surface glycoprotein CD28-like n=1 Tax=Hoplias malabaricus TaxID=27720 RepID=UPI0034621664